MTTIIDEDYYDPEDIAEMLQISLGSVRSLIRKGDIPGKKIGGDYIVSEADLKSFLNNGKTGKKTTTS